MTIGTKECKQAIVDFLAKNKGHVASQFVGDFSEIRGAVSVATFEAPSLSVSNWKRESKEVIRNERDACIYGVPIGTVVRAFDCRPYEDQLRAYVYSDGTTISCVRVEGE